MNFLGDVPMALFNPGYDLPFGGAFDPSGIFPVVSIIKGADLNAFPTSLHSYIPQVGYYSKLELGASPGTGSNFPNSVYANGFLMTPLGGLTGPSGQLAFAPFDTQTSVSQLPFQKLTQPIVPAAALANPQAPAMFGPPIGNIHPERKYGTWTLEFYSGTLPSPASNVNTVLKMEIGGVQYKGWGIQVGGDSVPDQWGPITWLSGVVPINNTYLDLTSGFGLSENFMYFPKNTYRAAQLVTYKAFTPYDATYGWREGGLTTPFFNDPVLQAAYLAGDFDELSCTRNGWTALIRADNYAFPGSKWAIIFMDYQMANYYNLKIDPRDPNARATLSQTVQRPSFKIDASGTAWLLAGDATGHISTSFSLSLAFSPVILPIPPSTFALPCFDPCTPELWVSQIQGALFKPPITGA